MQTLTVTANDEIIKTLKAFIDNFANVKSSITKNDSQAEKDNLVVETTLTTHSKEDHEQQELFEIMKTMSERGTAFAGVDVMAWQKEQRTDKEMALRSE